MSKLRPHSNVVQFLGITSAPKLCIVTEFLDGGSLYDILHSDEVIEVSKKKIWVEGIIAGILHLHSEGVIHRDIAARNVLLNKTGQAKITDFGMSRIAVPGKVSNQTKSQTGPLKWMAPESIEKRIYSEESDCWSFGVLLWEIATRAEPYNEMSPMETALAVTRGSPPLRLHPPSDCPSVLAELMALCFQTAPEARPSFKIIWQRMEQSRAGDWEPVRAEETNTYGKMPTSQESTGQYTRTPTQQSQPPQASQSAYGHMPSEL